MTIKFFCPRWGNTQSWNDFLLQVKQAGYNGIEAGIAPDITPAELDSIYNLSAQHGLEVIGQHYSTYDADFNRHYDNYCSWFEMMSPYPSVRINTQTGKDFFTFEQNKQLVDFTVTYSEKYNMPLSHETHRNKFTFAAHITKEYLQRLDYLRLTLDLSHWVNVAESYLEDQQEAVDLAISRTDHLHARVGYPEGPQVPDPRVPEWQGALNHHLAWWDKVIATKKAAGASQFTIAPEFGPYPYMVPLPFTQQPITNQWEVNKFMMELLRERY